MPGDLQSPRRDQPTGGVFSRLRRTWLAASNETELRVVLWITVGPMAVVSGLRLAARLSDPAITFTNVRLLRTIAIEFLYTAILIPMLRRRGWNAKRLSLKPGIKLQDLLPAAALWVGTMALYYAIWIFAYYVMPESITRAAALQPSGVVSAWCVVLVSLLNPIFEETLYLGYAASVLRSRGSTYALNVTIVCRLLLHIYQGPVGALSMVPVGFVFGSYYLRTGRIWPVIIAHGIMDAVGLSALAQHSS